MTQSLTGQKVFGSGYFFGIPNISNPTPTAFGACQNMSAEFKRDLKYLHGTNQIAIENAAGKLTVSGKVEMATMNARLVNDLLLGTTLATGQTIWVKKEIHALTTTTITIAPPNSGVFATDLGVTNLTTNVPLTRVASAPTTGQYSQTAGVYTFAAADEGNNMAFDYTATVSSQGQSISMTNQPMGKTGNFTAVMASQYGTDLSTIQLNNCMGGSFSLQTKLDDFAMPSFDYGAATDGNDVLGILSLSSVH